MEDIAEETASFGLGAEVPMDKYMEIQLNILSSISESALRAAVNRHFGLQMP